MEALETLVGGSGTDVVTVRSIQGTTMMVSAVETWLDSRAWTSSTSAPVETRSRWGAGNADRWHRQ